MKAPQTRTTATRSKAAGAAHPSADQIALRAHELFVARGRLHGQDLDDWLQAERELQKPNGARRRKSSPARAEASAPPSR